jgi:surface protein
MSIISIGIPIPDRSALPGQTGDGNEVNLQYSTQNYCANSSNASPTVATPAGGTFSYAPGGISGGANGTIVIANSNPGNYTVTYTVAGIGSANFPINISALDDASFSYSASAFCADASNQTPTIATPGGAFTTQDITFRPFQMQFEVASGISKTITIPNTVGSSYTVDWGDETTTTESAGNISHTYDGSYPNPTVSIGAAGDSGPFTTFSFSGGGSRSDLLDVPQWGSIQFTSLYYMFSYCNNASFQISATDSPDLTNATSMSGTFNRSTFNSNINHWNVSTITTMQNCFVRASSFNQPLNNWDTSSLENVQSMFFRSSSFNQPLNNWDTGSITTFGDTFYLASLFNQNISDWDFNSLLITGGLINTLNSTSITTENYTDTLVGWAVKIYKNSGPYSISFTGSNFSSKFDGTRTSDNTSGQTYAAKYGSDWTATGWTDAQDAYDYLVGATAGWTIN